MKDGAVVDKASELGDIAHVYKEGDTFYSAVLGEVDISCGLNAYYKLQLLEADAGKKRYKHRAYHSWQLVFRNPADFTQISPVKSGGFHGFHECELLRHDQL